MAAAELFDHPPRPGWTQDFLSRSGHHLLLAYADGEPVGFVTGIEIAHPDKTPEMLLYELGVDPRHRRQGFGRALVMALGDLARARDCRGMWVPLEPDDEPAAATYRSAGAEAAEDATIMSWRFPAAV